MKKTTGLTGVFILFIIFCLNSCNNDENEAVLSNYYLGVLSVEYTRGFPQYTATAKLDVDVRQDGTIIFSGGGDSDEIDAEDILYEEGKPVTKIKVTGTLVFNGAQGEAVISGSDELARIRVSSDLFVQMTVWAWDDDLGWIQMFDMPHTQQDQYSDGDLEFNINTACSSSGHDIKATFPDIQGTFTYGYNLSLVPGLK